MTTHLCNVWLTQKETRVRKVRIDTRCSDEATEFFEIDRVGPTGGVYKICRCAAHSKNVGRGLKKGMTRRVTKEQFEITP